jgi:exonuclease VII large subunit
MTKLNHEMIEALRDDTARLVEQLAMKKQKREQAGYAALTQDEFEWYTGHIAHASEMMIIEPREEMTLLEEYALQLRSLVAERLSHEKVATERISGELSRSAVVLLTNLSHRLERAEESIHDGALRLLRQSLEKVESYATVVESFSPESLLSLGFAVVRGARSVEDVAVGDSVTIELRDGEVEASEFDAKQQGDDRDDAEQSEGSRHDASVLLSTVADYPRRACSEDREEGDPEARQYHRYPRVGDGR